MKYILWGIIVFGLGGLITGLLGDDLLIGFAVMGALSGGTLPVLFQNPKRAWFGVLQGAAGFFLGFLIMFFIVIALWEPPFPTIFIGLCAGAFGGLSLGAVMKRWKMAGYLSLGGSLGFGIGMALFEWIGLSSTFREFLSSPIWTGISMMLVCMIGGLGLGMALWLAERKKDGAP